MNNIRKVKVGIDYDNILFNTNEVWCDLYNSMTGNHLKITNIKEWDITKFVLPQHKELILDLLNNKLLWNNIKPIHDAQMYMRMLSQDEDIEIYNMTDTFPQTAEIKIDMLHKSYPYIDIRNNLFIAKNKQMIDVDILLDDYQNNLIGGKYRKILFDYPWNKNFDEKEYDIVRVNDWIQAYSEIKRQVELVKKVMY